MYIKRECTISREIIQLHTEKKRIEQWLSGAGEGGRMGYIGQKVQTSSYKTNKFRGSNVQHGDYS